MSEKEQRYVNAIVAYKADIQVKHPQSYYAQKAGVSSRQFLRLVQRFDAIGTAGIVHKSRGNRSNNTVPEEIVSQAGFLVANLYPDFNACHLSEKLEAEYQFKLSREFVRQLKIDVGVHKPRRRRWVQIHQIRERSKYYGELVQVDGSPHDWFEGRGEYCTLLVYIDDATSELLWLEFVDSESTQSYFKATHNYFTRCGLPGAFYVDKHSVFRVN